LRHVRSPTDEAFVAFPRDQLTLAAFFATVAWADAPVIPSAATIRPCRSGRRPIIVGSRLLETIPDTQLSATANRSSWRERRLTVSAPSLTTEANLPTIGLQADDDPRDGNMLSEVGGHRVVCMFGHI
jgi:hypothetical protein